MMRRLADSCAVTLLAVGQHLALLLGAAVAYAAAPAPPAHEANAEQQLKIVLGLTADKERGARLFAICTACHGASGEGYVSGWPPEIAGQHPRVLAKELVDFRTGARQYDPMERIAGRHVLHTSQDIADIAAYVAALPPSFTTAPGNGKWVEQGGVRYAQRCASCHGARGEGSDVRFVPRVASQQYEYLVRQLYDCVQGRRHNMQSQHRHLMDGFTREDFAGVADYMSRLGRAD